MHASASSVLLALLMLHSESVAVSNDLASIAHTEKDFAAWSNSAPLDQSIAQLRQSLSRHESIESIAQWLSKYGFTVESPRQAAEGFVRKDPKDTSESHAGILQTLVASWDVRRQGIIFEHRTLIRWLASMYYFGVSVEVTCTENPMTVHDILVTRSSL